MEKYEKIEAIKQKGPENEIRLNQKTPIKNYLKYIITLFKEKRADEVVLKSMGTAIDKVIIVAEIVKHRIKGLHQITDIALETFEDVYEPLEEGLDRLTFKRDVPSLVIILSRNDTLDKTHSGYQEPLDQSLVNEELPIPNKKWRKPHLRMRRRPQRRRKRIIRGFILGNRRLYRHYRKGKGEIKLRRKPKKPIPGPREQRQINENKYEPRYHKRRGAYMGPGKKKHIVQDEQQEVEALVHNDEY